VKGFRGSHGHVQRAMRFDVLHDHAFQLQEGLQGTNLVYRVLYQFLSPTWMVRRPKPTRSR
jgi:hypothetical protein